METELKYNEPWILQRADPYVVKAEDGNPIMVYHARTESKIEGDPLYNPNRHAMLMQISYDSGKRPVFAI